VSDENDAKVLNEVQDRFEVNITELPEEIDISSYSKISPYFDCSGIASLILFTVEGR
jgi:hypothetical protein